MSKFIFIIHPLSLTHRQIVGARCRKWSLVKPDCDYTATKNITSICRFHLNKAIEGEVVCIPSLPQQMLAEQQVALDLMHHCVKSVDDVDAVGLGSLCAVVAGRGTALQNRVEVPVTTGNAATAWCLFSNLVTVAERMSTKLIGIVGSGSPVGIAVTSLLTEAGFSLQVDSKKAAKKTGAKVCDSAESTVEGCLVIAGCGPTGPALDGQAIRRNAALVDVALPHTIDGKVPSGVTVYMGEAMSMPKAWRRGFWGPLYHLVSGYGWSTVLACLVEPLIIVSSGREQPFAQGRKIDLQSVKDFGKLAAEIGFFPQVRQVQKWM